MPLMLNVFNTTLEDHKIQFNSKAYRFRARSLTKVPEEFEFSLNEYYAKKGLVIVNPGDDLKAKENEGLKSYLTFLNDRLQSFQLYLDEKKRNGVTIDEPEEVQKLKKWKQEIRDRLKLSGVQENIPSFADQPDIDRKSLFGGEMQIQEITEKPKLGKAKSFSEVSIDSELSA